jgi:hypothetical protein
VPVSQFVGYRPDELVRFPSSACVTCSPIAAQPARRGVSAKHNAAPQIGGPTCSYNQVPFRDWQACRVAAPAVRSGGGRTAYGPGRRGAGERLTKDAAEQPDEVI